MAATILVGYDGSEASAAALEAARAAAAQGGDEIQVITAYDYSPQSFSARQGPDPANERRADEADALAARACALLHDVPASPRSAPGPLPDVAAAVAEDVQPRLLVLGRSPELLRHLGRETRALTCPLMVVPAPADRATDADDDVWRAAVDAARRAPSTHNTQPWTFRRTNDGLELVADATRALSAVDPEGRELIIS